jgi:hypothetical protein
LNTSNTISLKYDNTKLNVDASGNLTVIGGTSRWTTIGTSTFYNTGKVIVNGNIQLQPKLLLSETEFYTGSFTSTEGMAFL